MLFSKKLWKRNDGIDRVLPDTTELLGSKVTDILVQNKIYKILPVHPKYKWNTSEGESFDQLLHKH